MNISDSQWAVFEKIINNAHSFFNQEDLTWVRQTNNLQRYGEDTKANKGTEEIILKCLNGYNYFRSWPMTDETSAGKLDKESMIVLLNKKYLLDAGYLTSDGNFNFDPGADHFIFQGQKMDAAGETPMSQAKSSPLFIMLILKREPTQTGSSKY